MSSAKEIRLEGLLPSEILALADDELHGLIFTGGPIVFHAGSATILGEFRIDADALVVEFAQIDRGGEGVLRTVWMLAQRYAQSRGLKAVEWIVHAVTCATPNLKLRRVLERVGFRVRSEPGRPLAYRYRLEVRPGVTPTALS